MNSTSHNDKQQSEPKQSPKGPQQGHPLFDWRPLFYTLFLFSLYYAFSSQGTSGPVEIPYTQFKQQLYNEEVGSVVFRGQQISGRYSNSERTKGYDFVTHMPSIPDDSLLPAIENHKVELIAKSEELPTWASVLINLLPWILIFGFFAYSNRALQSRMGGGGGGGLFGTSFRLPRA